MKSKKLPYVSFIIPTYNADKDLERCLQSIEKLNYDNNKFEIIVADGDSTDNTKTILKNHDVIVIRNKARNAEQGKHLAFTRSKGKYTVLLDADNELASETWLKDIIAVLEKQPKAVGAESNYLISNDFSSINKYASLLIIVDPLARMLGSRPNKIHHQGTYHVKTYGKGSTPISGANGFVWRRSVLEPIIQNEITLEESSVLQMLASKSQIDIINIEGVGIYHYYCDSLFDFIGKRRKIAQKFLHRQTQKITWIDTRSRSKFLVSSLYLATIVGPLIEGIYNAFKYRRLSWLWHPIAGLLTIVVYTYYFIGSKIGFTR